MHCVKTIFNANLVKRNMIARHKTEDLCAHKTVIKEEDARVRIGEEL